MNLNLDLKKFLEKTPKTVFQKPVTVSFYCKENDFLPYYCAKFMASSKNLKLESLNINKTNVPIIIESVTGNSFFDSEKVFYIKGVDLLPKKEQEKFLKAIKSGLNNTVFLYVEKYPVQKSWKDTFYNISVFDIPQWFYKKFVTDIMDECGVEYDDVLIEKILEQIYGKDLDYINTQLMKLALYLVDKKEEDAIDSDIIKEALYGKENNYYEMMDQMFRFLMIGEYENFLTLYLKLKDYLESIAIISFLIKRVRLFTEFYSIYGKNEFFDSFVDKYKNSSRFNYGIFMRDKKELQKVLSEKNINVSFLDNIYNPYILNDFNYIFSSIREDFLKKIFFDLIKMDAQFKTGLIKTPDDIVLILTGRLKNEDIRR